MFTVKKKTFGTACVYTVFKNYFATLEKKSISFFLISLYFTKFSIK